MMMGLFDSKAKKAERENVQQQLVEAKKERVQATRDSSAALTRFQRVLRKAPAIEMGLLGLQQGLIGSKRDD